MALGTAVSCHLAGGGRTATEYVVDVLGGASVFKGRTFPTPTELRERIRRGLPYRSLESVRERLGLSVPEAASVLQMPPRTLARRRTLASWARTNRTDCIESHAWRRKRSRCSARRTKPRRGCAGEPSAER